MNVYVSLVACDCRLSVFGHTWERVLSVQCAHAACCIMFMSDFLH